MQPTPTPPPVSPRRKLLTTLYTIYLVVVGGYLAYGTFTQTGVSGWVMAKQLDWFGSASVKLTMLLPLLVAMVLPLLVVAPFLPKGQRAQLAGPLVPPSTQPARPMTWRQVLIMAAVPPLLALPIYFYVVHEAEADQHRPVVPLDLIARPDAPVPPDTKFARLQGVFQADYQYVLEETSYGRVNKTDRYVPLTGPDWRPGQPVRFFLDTSISAYYDESDQRMVMFDNTSAFPATFGGELSAGSLPTVVRQEFGRHQVTAAEPHYVLKDGPLPNGQAANIAAQMYWLIPVLGVGLGLALLLGGGLGMLIRRRRGLDAAGR